MVDVCPMCQMNLDAYQGEMNRFFKTDYHMPILFFTQFMGLAFGIEAKELGFGLELVVGPQGAEPASASRRPETGSRRRPKRRRKPDGPADAAACPRSEAGRMTQEQDMTLTANERGTHRRLCLPLRHQHRRHGGRRPSRRLGRREPEGPRRGRRRATTSSCAPAWARS